MSTITTRFRGHDLTIERVPYSDPLASSDSVFITDENGDVYEQLSVNLTGYMTQTEDSFFIKGEFYDTELLNHLEAEGIISPTGLVVPYGAFNSRAREYELHVQ